MKVFINIVLGLTVLTVLGIVGVATYEQSVFNRLEEILDSGSLPASVRRTPAAPEFAEAFDALTEKLEKIVGNPFESQDEDEPGPAGVPWKWTLEHKDWLNRTADRAEPILIELDQLLASEELQRVKEDDGTYAGKSRTGEKLGPMRHWTNVQCASAISLARHGQFERAVDRMAGAFYLARLVDEKTVIGGLLRAAETNIVTDAAARILQEHPGAASFLQSALNEHLIGIVNEEWAIDVFWSDAVCHLWTSWKTWDENDSYAEQVGRAVVLDEVLEAMEQARELEFRLDRLDEDARRTLGAMTYDVEVSSELFQKRRAQFLRVILEAFAFQEKTGNLPASLEELSDQFNGETPIDISSGEAFRFNATSESLSIALPESTRHLDEGHESPMWSGEFSWDRRSEH